MMNMEDRKTIRIGGACAFVGDSILGPRQLVAVEGMQYLVFDYLAEMTLSAFAHSRKLNPELGYATEFVDLTLREILSGCASRGIKLVSNAGGLNPAGCALAIQSLQRELGTRLKVAYVEGDDCMSRIAHLRQVATPDMHSGDPMPRCVDSANIYLGALPIAHALGIGADIVITGRVVDSATTLGILIHEFGWSTSDYDALAMGSLAGHILECGPQATGGIHTDWRSIPNWENIGYPYLDCEGAKRFTVRKPPGTGGRITRGTVSEQVLYEVGDPARYLLPDVTCDFTKVTVSEIGENEVVVQGALGIAPSATYKLTASYLDGHRCVAQIAVFGVDAVAKARRTGEALLLRSRAMILEKGWEDFDKTAVTVIGAEDGYGPHARDYPLREAIARVAVTHARRDALDIFSREARVPGVSFAPGTTTGSALLYNSRPAVEPVYRIHSGLVRKTEIDEPRVILGARCDRVEIPQGTAGVMATPAPAESEILSPGTPARGQRVQLIRLAYGRSGDKGDTSNIAIIARHPSLLPVIESSLTAAAVKGYLHHLVEGPVVRYAVPGIHALNFVLEGALDGGGPSSLRTDPMGKGLAQQLLEFEVDLPEGFDIDAVAAPEDT
jgi:hypothetical protein